MRTDSVLLDEINACFKRNAWKVLFSLIAYMVSQQFILAAFLIPARILPTALSIPLTIPFALGASVCMFVFLYGFMVIIKKVHAAESAIIGDILCGFHDFYRIAPSALLFSAISFGAVILASVGGAAVFAVFPSTPLNGTMICVLMLAYGVCILYVVFPYLFVWFELHNKPTAQAAAAFMASKRLLRGQKLHLLCLLLRAGGGFLAATAFIYALNFYTGMAPALAKVLFGEAAVESAPLPAAIAFFASNKMSRILSVVYYVASLVTSAKIAFALAVFYDELTGRTDVPRIDAP